MADLLSQYHGEYLQAQDDTYSSAMHRALLDLLASMDARIRALEAPTVTADAAQEAAQGVLTEAEAEWLDDAD